MQVKSRHTMEDCTFPVLQHQLHELLFHGVADLPSITHVPEYIYINPHKCFTNITTFHWT